MSSTYEVSQMWFKLGATANVAHPMARNNITPERASHMSDRELGHIRNVGPKAIAAIRQIVQYEQPVCPCCGKPL